MTTEQRPTKESSKQKHKVKKEKRKKEEPTHIPEKLASQQIPAECILFIVVVLRLNVV